MFKFETLDIWKESINFVAEIYSLTERFPNKENYNLTSQMARAAVSISLNISEGASRNSKTDFRRFIQIAIGSLNEVVTCLYIARNQDYINQDNFDQIYKRCEQISRMLYGFKKYLAK